MNLYGTTTSPYVRRVRFVLEDLELPYTLVDVFTDAGQAELRARNPLWFLDAHRAHPVLATTAPPR
jgi:glutathione S-transferase